MHVNSRELSSLVKPQEKTLLHRDDSDKLSFVFELHKLFLQDDAKWS